MNNKNVYLFVGISMIVLFGLGIYKTMELRASTQMQPNAGVVPVVAAENFYGDIASQLGGNHVKVLSILSDPNADPHQYESSVQDAVAVANADIVIEN